MAFFAVENGVSSAMAQNVYTVENVKVDISADSPLTAREQAFSQGQHVAFAALAKSLGNPEAGQDIDPAVLSGLIKDFEIVDEKLAPNRYAVTYIFRFKRNESDRFFSSRAAHSPSPFESDRPDYGELAYGEDVSPIGQDQYGKQGQMPMQQNQNTAGRPSYSELFANDEAYTQNMNERALSGQGFGDTAAPSVQPQHHPQQPHQAAQSRQSDAISGTSGTILLLPYWRNGGDLTLWGAQNPWTQTWRRLENVADNQFILPLGDLADMQQIGDRLPEDPRALQKLFARYQVKEAVIAIGQQTPRSITTTLYKADEAGLHFWKVMDSPLGPVSDVYSVAVGEVLRDIQSAPAPDENYAQNNNEPSRGFRMSPQAATTPYAPTDNVASPYYNYGQNTLSSQDQPVIGQAKDQRIMVEGRFANAQEWLQMKGLLDQVNGIGGIQIVSLKPNSAVMYMEISQSIDTVRQSLAGYRLDLGQNPRVPASGQQAATYYLRFNMNGV